MVDHAEIQGHLTLSAEYLAVATAAAADGRQAASYHNALHALELGIKAALATKLDEVPRTHNVGGIFAREFRTTVGDETCSRINSLVRDYDAPRYPDWEAPDTLDDDLRFIATFLTKTLPKLVRGAR